MMKNGHPYGLAIHTASPELGLAITNFAGDRRSQTWHLGRETSNLLHTYLTDFLPPQTWQDLDFIAVAQGPGGFTGTRIGVVTARTLAQQLDLPLFAVSTLAGVAWDAGKTLASPEVDIAVQMPARRGEWFCAIYRFRLNAGTVAQEKQATTENLLINPVSLPAIQSVLPDQVLSLEDWQAVLAQWDRFYQRVELEEKSSASVTSILEIGYASWLQGDRPHWSEALPFYGQHPVN
jgi:tRNA threonylcarbamoyl adenosine modification protein YeaZ